MLLLLPLLLMVVQMIACANKDNEIVDKGVKKPALNKFQALKHVSSTVVCCDLGWSTAVQETPLAISSSGSNSR